MRSTQKAIEEAELLLGKMVGDDEVYHSLFDELLEKRLEELDPEFMRKMTKMYDDSNMARWCA